jgi:hypothetical protein
MAKSPLVKRRYLIYPPYLFEQSPDIILVIIPDGSFPDSKQRHQVVDKGSPLDGELYNYETEPRLIFPYSVCHVWKVSRFLHAKDPFVERSAGVLFHNCTTLHLEDFPYPPPGDVQDISQSWIIKTNTWTQSSLFKIRKKVFYEKRKIDDIKVAPLFSDNIFPIS